MLLYVDYAKDFILKIVLAYHVQKPFKATALFVASLTILIQLLAQLVFLVYHPALKKIVNYVVVSDIPIIPVLLVVALLLHRIVPLVALTFTLM